MEEVWHTILCVKSYGVCSIRFVDPYTAENSGYWNAFSPFNTGWLLLSPNSWVLIKVINDGAFWFVYCAFFNEGLVTLEPLMHFKLYKIVRLSVNNKLWMIMDILKLRDFFCFFLFFPLIECRGKSTVNGWTLLLKFFFSRFPLLCVFFF